MGDLPQSHLCLHLYVKRACRAQAVAEDRDALNGVQQLSQEATIVNQNFSQQARCSHLCPTSSAAGAAAIVLSTIVLPEVTKMDTCAALASVSCAVGCAVCTAKASGTWRERSMRVG